MSVLIKGMKMPKNCGECPMICEDDLCHITKGGRTINERPPHCPLIEMSPHGRLIDADAAAKRGWTISRTYSASPTEMVYEARTMNDEVLPTIIEAEENIVK